MSFVSRRFAFINVWRSIAADQPVRRDPLAVCEPRSVCEEDKVPAMSKINVEIREFGVIKLGVPRATIKEEVCVESSYDQKAAKKK